MSANNENYKKIIPCLDVKDGKVVKGIKFVDLKLAGDPVELSKKYEEEGADELVFLDIDASWQERKTSLEMVERVAKNVSLPFTVGGGVGSIEDMKNIFGAGANKVSINTAAVKDPILIEKGVEKFGSEKIVVAIDAKREDGSFVVYTSGGRKSTGLKLGEWAKEVKEKGAGEILLTSIDCDGGKNGYDLEMTALTADKSTLPVIASGGAGEIEDFYLAFTEGKAKGALAASVFHYGEIKIEDLKKYLYDKGVKVKL